MPPHCDSVDGPVVTAAREALESGSVELVLPFVPVDAESEVRSTFDSTLAVRGLGDEARETADRLFFETVVRLHRAGEGEPFTGLKPAGLPTGPAIPLAEHALESRSVDELADFLSAALREQLTHRLDHVTELAVTKDRSVPDARAHVEARLGFQVYSHHLLEAILAPAHAHGPAEVDPTAARHH